MPGVGLDEQLFYVNGQAAFQLSEKAALAVGGLYAAGADEELDAGVLYGVTTLGRPDRSLTLGFALGSTRQQEDEFGPRGQYLGSRSHWRSEPIVMVGGSIRVAKRLALVSESWLFLEKPLSEQPFGLALRFFSDRISVDVGFVLVPEVLDEGFPIPWLSFSYHFGPSRSAVEAPRTRESRRTSKRARLAGDAEAPSGEGTAGTFCSHHSRARCGVQGLAVWHRASCSASHSAEGGRASGSLARQARTRSSSEGGIAQVTLAEGGTGFVLAWWRTTSIGVEPEKTRWPVSSQ